MNLLWVASLGAAVAAAKLPASQSLGRVAAGTIGVARAARVAPDGYTIGIGHWSTHVVNPAIYPMTFNILDDLEPLASIATNPQLVVTRKDFPADDLKALIAYAKANPEK